MTNGIQERYSPLRVLRWGERIEAALRGERPGPVRCNLDIENRCNDSCWFCEPAEYRAQTMRDRHFTLDTQRALEVLEDLKALDCRTVTFSGGGEPTLHPDFGPILQVAKESGFTTQVITHGGFIDKWKLPLLHHADYIRVSLDAATDGDHRAVHASKPGEFEKRIEAIRGLCALRAGAKHKPNIALAYIVNEKNAMPFRLNRFVELAEELGVDYVYFRPLSEPTGQGAALWQSRLPLLEQMQKETHTVQILVLGHRAMDVFHQREFQKCYVATTFATVGADGNTQACCDRRDLVWGNVYEQRFKDIWLGARHRKGAGEIVPKFCERCLQCGTNAAIQKYVIENQATAELL